MSGFGQPEHVRLIPDENETQDFPDDPEMKDPNASEATERAIREGTARRRPNPFPFKTLRSN